MCTNIQIYIYKDLGDPDVYNAEIYGGKKKPDDVFEYTIKDVMEYIKKLTQGMENVTGVKMVLMATGSCRWFCISKIIFKFARDIKEYLLVFELYHARFYCLFIIL